MLEIDWHVLDNPSAPRANGSLPPVNAARIARHELLVRLASSFAYARVLRILADVEPTLTKEMADSSLAPRLYARELRARVALTGRRMDENRLRSELRSAVVAYARALHERDVPPQKMLVMVKECRAGADTGYARDRRGKRHRGGYRGMGHRRLLHDLADANDTDWSTIAIADEWYSQVDHPQFRRPNPDTPRPHHVTMVGAAVCAAIAWSAASMLAQQPGPTSPSAASSTSLVGVVGDSLHGGPLVGAVVMIEANSRTAVTDSIGRFRIDSIPPGRYRVAIYHAVVDSLGISLVTLPVEFDVGRPLLVSLAIPSGGTIRQTLCSQSGGAPPDAHLDTGPALLVGRVLDPETDTPIPNVAVTLEWTPTVVSLPSVQASAQHRAAVTGDDGRFCLCGLPAQLTGTLRAAFQSAPELAVERTLTLDNRIVTMAALHLPRTSPGLPAAQRDRAELAGVVQRPDGSPLPHAIVTLAGTPHSATTGRDGTFVLRGLPAGTQTIQVRSVGFEEAEQVVELALHSAEHVTVTLATVARVLSPVLVSTQRLQAGYARVGFDRRRHAGLGQFLSADDIAKRHAIHFSELLNGSPAIESERALGSDNPENDRGVDPCLTYVVDGHPVAHLGESDVDALYQAGQIVGVEIYSGADAPSEFRVPGLTSEQIHDHDVRNARCATVVLWTKAHLLTDQGQ